MKSDFFERLDVYFPNQKERFVELLNEEKTQGFFINSAKAKKNKVFDIIDFDYKESTFNEDSYFHHNKKIGKSKAYELGLIYPQDIESSLPSTIIDYENISLVLDLCSAPGGKAINILNKLKNEYLYIANDIEYKRAEILASNLERMGFDQFIVCSKSGADLENVLYGACDLVVLDAPCSGEGMIRKYPEILEDYQVDNIVKLAKIQEDLLENAYNCLKENGQLIYSTCTYALEEDENQIINFLNKHQDMELIEINKYPSASKLDGTIKLSILDGVEGQFFALLRKRNPSSFNKLSYLKTVKNKLVDDFLKENLNICNYNLYVDKERYYLAFVPLIDLGKDVLRKAIYIGKINKNYFEPSHALYRANVLKDLFKFTYNLTEQEYDLFVSGQVINADVENHYYALKYKDIIIGFGKASNKQIKNKYPKGLRRMV